MQNRGRPRTYSVDGHLGLPQIYPETAKYFSASGGLCQICAINQPQIRRISHNKRQQHTNKQKNRRRVVKHCVYSTSSFLHLRIPLSPLSEIHRGHIVRVLIFVPNLRLKDLQSHICSDQQSRKMDLWHLRPENG